MSELIFAINFFDDAFYLLHKLKYILGMFYSEVYFIFHSAKPWKFDFELWY